MSKMFDFGYRQRVTEDELNNAFIELEQADRSIVGDLGFFGVYKGLVVTQHAGTPALTVDVTAGGTYDKGGQRIAVGTNQTVNMAVDSSSVSTAVATPGNAKVVSLFLVFQRVLSDPRIDGNGDTVYFQRAESYEFRVTQGVEATLGSEVATALTDDAILLADVKLVYGTTQILNAAINPYMVNRRQDFDLITPAAPDVNALIAAALADTPSIVNAVISGSSTRITSSAVRRDGNARGKTYFNEADIATTDATVTDAFTWSIVDECVTTVVLQISAIKSDGSEYRSVGIRCVIQRDGGTVTVGAVDFFHDVPSTAFAALAITVDNSGSTGRVRVTGLALTTISWFVAVTRLEHTHA